MIFNYGLLDNTSALSVIEMKWQYHTYLIKMKIHVGENVHE
jgi:hypothetical protein